MKRGKFSNSKQRRVSSTLPPGNTWRQVAANVFSVVDGKRILFKNDDSLFQKLRNGSPSVAPTREQVAMNMRADEIHEDVHQFIGKLLAFTQMDRPPVR